MKNFKFTIRGHNYEVEILNFENGYAEIEVNGTPYEVEVHSQIKETKTPVLVRSAVETPKGAHKIKKKIETTTKIKAPLPGNIMQIFVKEGDNVNKNDKLLLYEAMKMENILLAEKDGVIKSIKIAAGDSVLQGDVLIEIE